MSCLTLTLCFAINVGHFCCQCGLCTAFKAVVGRHQCRGASGSSRNQFARGFVHCKGGYCLHGSPGVRMAAGEGAEEQGGRAPMWVVGAWVEAGAASCFGCPGN